LNPPLTLKKISQELIDLANDLRQKEVEMANEVREAGAQTQDGFDRVLRAIHRLNRYAALLPDRLKSIAEKVDAEKEMDL